MLRCCQCRCLLALVLTLCGGTAGAFADGDDGVATPPVTPGSAVREEQATVANVPWLDLRPGKSEGLTAEEEQVVRDEVARLESQIQQVPGFEKWEAPKLWDAEGVFIGKMRIVSDGDVSREANSSPKGEEIIRKQVPAGLTDSLVVTTGNVHITDAQNCIVFAKSSFCSVRMSGSLVRVSGSAVVSTATDSVICADAPLNIARANSVVASSSVAVRVGFGQGNVIVNSPAIPSHLDSSRNYKSTSRNEACSLYANKNIKLTLPLNVEYLPDGYTIGLDPGRDSLNVKCDGDETTTKAITPGEKITLSDGTLVPHLEAWTVRRVFIFSRTHHVEIINGNVAAILVY
ncbi:MAG: hypothetical protein R3C01_02870 [Planctomycetaceae bacterium]